MEDWLNDSVGIECNLSASGCRDFFLEEFLRVCNVDIHEFSRLFLGDNTTMGTPELGEEIRKSYRQVELPGLMVTNGTSEAIFVFFNELLEAGDEVVIPFPAFQCLYQVPIAIGCEVKFLNLLTDENWKLDINKLAALVTPKTKLIIINNPHNPLGWTLSAEELRQVGEIARENDCWLFFDEHYRYLPLEEGTRLIPSGYDICKPIHEKTWASGSMIKCFGIVGIRIGWLIGDPQFLARCRDYKDYLTHTIPSVTDFLAYIALKNKEEIIKIKKSHILPNVELLNRFMGENRDSFEYLEPAGGVVCFPKLNKESDSAGFCKILREKYQVSLLPGFAFDADGDFNARSHFRINIGVETGIFNKALERIQTYLKQTGK
jgi:aspartate/methionine/tyrosine aminotransferase